MKLKNPNIDPIKERVFERINNGKRVPKLDISFEEEIKKHDSLQPEKLNKIKERVYKRINREDMPD